MSFSCNNYPRKFSFVLIILLCLSRNYCVAQNISNPKEHKDSIELCQKNNESSLWLDTSYQKVNKQFILEVIKDFGFIISSPVHWKQKNWLKFSALAAGTGTLLLLDKPIKNAILSNQNKTIYRLGDYVEPLGDYGLGIFPLIYAEGLIGQNKRMQHLGLCGSKAVVIASATNLILKNIINRGRPFVTNNPYNFALPFSKKDFDAMPSGHSTIAFAIATAFSQEFPEKKWIAPVAYSLASLTAISRVYHNKHWASDVLVGSAVGYFVTKAVYAHKKKRKH